MTLHVIDADDDAKLRKVAKEICEEVGTLCFDGVSDVRKLVNFALAYLETFVILEDKAIECIKHDNCVSQALRMCSEVFQLALEGKYVYLFEPRLYIETARKLKELD